MDHDLPDCSDLYGLGDGAVVCGTLVNSVDHQVWDGTSWRWCIIMRVSNTLAGRLIIGPVIGTASFIASELRQFKGDVRRAWMLHIPAMLFVLALVWLSPMPLWAYALSCYFALAILKIRTFLEHRTHNNHCARTVVIEDKGPLALLFLNNNYHVVHHMNPTVGWYDLPTLYRAKAARFLQVNDGFHYSGYGQVFRHYFLMVKDPVSHPLWRSK